MKNFNNMAGKLSLLAFILCLGFTHTINAQLWQGKGRIAISSDGNQHDSDDWGATAVTLAIIANRGLQNKVVHYDYANHVWNNDNFFENQITESALGAADRFGFDKSKFHNGFRNKNKAINSLKNAVNASSANNPLFLIAAGPMEIPYQGILAANPNKRKFVTVISHSLWNNFHGDCDDGLNWTECHPGSHQRRHIEPLGVKWVQISDQNENKFSPGSDAAWNFLNNLNGQYDRAYEWTYSRVVAVRTPGDASDAGIAYYLFTGDQNGNTTKLNNLMRSAPGGGDGGNGGTGGTVTIKAQSINKYISSENGNRSMRANRNNAGTQERFTVRSEGNGMVSFKGSNGKFVSHENGNKAMNCNRNVAQGWEKFTLVPQGGNVYAIKGSNGRYVSHENGSNNGITCNRTAIGSWEKFVIDGLTSNRAKENVSLKELNFKNKIVLSPNPLTTGNYNLQISSSKNLSSASVKIIDVFGKLILSKKLGTVTKGNTMVSLDKIRNTMSSGLYLVNISFDGNNITKKIFVE